MRQSIGDFDNGDNYYENEIMSYNAPNFDQIKEKQQTSHILYNDGFLPAQSR